MSITQKNCATCPSALTAYEAQVFFMDSNIKSSMCARFGYLLAEPEANSNVAQHQTLRVLESVGEHYADSCGQHGQPRPISPTGKFSPLLFAPDPVALSTYRAAGEAELDSCDKCTKLFYSQKHGEYGCKAKSIVVTRTRMQMEPKGCIWSIAKPAGSAAVPVEHKTELAPHFATPVTVRPSATKAAAKVNTSWTDPLTYSTDAPVADAHKGMIRAWRKVEMPVGDPMYLPIFETSFFSEADQKLIPRAGDDNDPSLYVDFSGLLRKFLVAVYKLDKPLCMVGEPGSGKTQGGHWLAAIMNVPFRRFSFHEFSEPEQYLGQMQLRSGETVFIPAGLPEGWTSVGVNLYDEFNLPMEGIVQVFRSMFDNSRELALFGQTFRRNDYCFPLLAINPSWDARNIGAKELASADVRRLSFHAMPYPDKDMQKGIIREYLKKVHNAALPTATLDAIIKASEDLRVMSKEGKIPHHWTISQDVKVAENMLFLGVEDAYKLAYFDYIDPITTAAAWGTIKSRFPSGV